MQNELALDLSTETGLMSITYEFGLYHTSGEVWPDHPDRDNADAKGDGNGQTVAAQLWKVSGDYDKGLRAVERCRKVEFRAGVTAALREGK